MKHSITRTTFAALTIAAAIVLPTASAGTSSGLQTTVRPDDRAGVRAVDGLAVQMDGRIWGVVDAAAAVANEPRLVPDGARTSTQPDPAYVRALNIRGQALNELNRVDPIRARHEAMNRLFAETPYERALRLRGEGLNAVYGGGSHPAVRPDDRGGPRTIAPVTATQVSSSGFDWRDAALGAIGAAGLSLLVGGGLLLTFHVVHQRRGRVAAL